MANGVLLTNPSLVLEAIGWESNASISGGVAISLPALSFVGGDIEGAQLQLPISTLAVDGVTGSVALVAIGITPQLQISGMAGVIGTVDLALPMMALETRDPDAVRISLPALGMAAVGHTGIVGSVVLIHPVLSLVATGNVPFVATAALSTRLQLAITGVSAPGATVDIALRRLALATAGHTGVVGRASLTIPMFDLAAGGSGVLIGQASLSVPTLVLQTTGYGTTVAPGANASTIVMHTETQALTTYDHFPFNSFARFNGVYLGASADGIFALAGADDAGVAIEAAARVGITDFSTSHLKRVDRCYVGYRADGDMVLRVTTEDQQVRDYRMQATGQYGLHTNIVRFGRGLEARYWQFELRNQNGADFALDAMELKPTVLRRRLWSKP